MHASRVSGGDLTTPGPHLPAKVISRVFPCPMTIMDRAWHQPGSEMVITLNAVGTNRLTHFCFYFWTPKIPPIFERMRGDLWVMELKFVDNPPHNVLDGQGFISIGLGVEHPHLEWVGPDPTNEEFWGGPMRNLNREFKSKTRFHVRNACSYIFFHQDFFVDNQDPGYASKIIETAVPIFLLI